MYQSFYKYGSIASKTKLLVFIERPTVFDHIRILPRISKPIVAYARLWGSYAFNREWDVEDLLPDGGTS